MKSGSVSSIMAQPTNIKIVIELLCSLCKKFHFSMISPELFRLAKFNSDDAYRPFWILLYEMIIRATRRKMAGNETCLEDVIPHVKAVLYDLGYREKEFFKLTPMQITGSREVLIALSWLIGKYSLIDLFLEQAEFDFFQLIIGREEELFQKLETQMQKDISIDGLLDRMLVLSNQSKMEWKTLRHLFKFFIKKVPDLNRETHSDDAILQQFLSNASVFEIITVIGCKKGCDKKMKLVLEKHNAILISYIKWIKNEELFWKWMSSVLDEKYKIEYNQQSSEYKCARNTTDILERNDEEQRKESFENLKTSDTSYFVSKLLHQAISVNWSIARERGQGTSFSNKISCPHGDIDKIERATKDIQELIVETERKLKILEEKANHILALENEDLMNDVIRLPFPNI